MPLSSDDRLAITEVIARYCHATDSGDGEGVAAEFAETGILEITGAWQARGYEQIKQIGDFPNKPKHWVNSIVMEGTGSTAQSTVYYAAIRGGGPLLATGRYDSQFTKQLNGEWKFVHHCYTGDPVPVGAAPARPTDLEKLTAEDRLSITEVIAHFNTAMQDRDGTALANLFTDDGTFQHGTDATVTGRPAISETLASTPPASGKYLTTNVIIEGTSEAAKARCYFALIDDHRVAETGLYKDDFQKADGTWRIVRHHYRPDSPDE
jgi:uncharacterized protein (TIGR02246 family)